MMCSTIFFIQLFFLPLLLKSLPIFLSVLLKSHVKLDIINQVTHSQVRKHYFVDCHVALWDELVQFHSLLGKLALSCSCNFLLNWEYRRKHQLSIGLKQHCGEWLKTFICIFPLCILNHVHFSPLKIIKQKRKKKIEEKNSDVCTLKTILFQKRIAY